MWLILLPNFEMNITHVMDPEYIQEVAKIKSCEA